MESQYGDLIRFSLIVVVIGAVFLLALFILNRKKQKTMNKSVKEFSSLMNPAGYFEAKPDELDIMVLEHVIKSQVLEKETKTRTEISIDFVFKKELNVNKSFIGRAVLDYASIGKDGASSSTNCFFMMLKHFYNIPESFVIVSRHNFYSDSRTFKGRFVLGNPSPGFIEQFDVRAPKKLYQGIQIPHKIQHVFLEQSVGFPYHNANDYNSFVLFYQEGVLVFGQEPRDRSKLLSLIEFGEKLERVFEDESICEEWKF